MREILSGQKKGRGLNGIGIRNVIGRIHSNFGEEYPVTIDSKPGEGTRVYLVLPCLKEDGYEAVSYTHLDVYKRQALSIPTT